MIQSKIIFCLAGGGEESTWRQEKDVKLARNAKGTRKIRSEEAGEEQKE